MIFSYWTCARPPFNFAMPEDAVQAWRAVDSHFAVHDDETVLAALAPRGEQATRLFARIRIPACKADLARLVLLHERGGIYVDAHCGPGAPEALVRLTRCQQRHELVLFDESVDSPEYRNTCIINGVLAAQAGSPIVDRLIQNALRRLQRLADAERRAASRHVAYNIYKLTGPWMIWHALYERADQGARLKPEFASRVAIWPFERDEGQRAVQLSRFVQYKQPGAHWSERQTHEALFDATPDRSSFQAIELGVKKDTSGEDGGGGAQGGGKEMGGAAI